MKILAFVSTIDLKYNLGCTPAWWQLLKALYEIGNEIIIMPYLGAPVESLWWRVYDNPCKTESIIFNTMQNKFRKHTPKQNNSCQNQNGNGIISTIQKLAIKKHIMPKIEKQLFNIIGREKDIGAILFMNIPLNHITGIPTKIKRRFGITTIYYDGDMPTILPKYANGRGFKFNYYVDADLSEYDYFFVNSKGVIKDIEEMGANNVNTLYYAADPDLTSPVNTEKDIDISFFGIGSQLREEWMTKMISSPSKKMQDANFVIGGSDFQIDMGNAKILGRLPHSTLRNFCCRSKINLNITRWSHTNIYASATTRLFELASYGACIVSQPYNGIEEWFNIGNELIVVNSEEEAIETYKSLLYSDEYRTKIGERARQRILKEHTYKHRAEKIVKTIKS